MYKSRISRLMCIQDYTLIRLCEQMAVQSDVKLYM